MTDVETLKSIFAGSADLLEHRLQDFLDHRQSLVTELHGKFRHPHYDYETTQTTRKSGESYPPEGKGWAINEAAGDGGFERDDFTDNHYWRRLKSMKQHDDVDPYQLPEIKLPKWRVTAIAERLRLTLKDYQWPGGVGSRVLDNAWTGEDWDHAYFVHHNRFINLPQQLRDVALSVQKEDGSDQTLYAWTAPGLPFRLMFGDVDSAYVCISCRRLSGEWGSWVLVGKSHLVPMTEEDFQASLKNSREVS